VHEEGWYRDPYGVHIDRWFSDGRPTALVRDGDRELNDPPPAGDVPGPVEPAPASAIRPLDEEYLRQNDPGWRGNLARMAFRSEPGSSRLSWLAKAPLRWIVTATAPDNRHVMNAMDRYEMRQRYREDGQA
jgi:hypothetical protein